MAEVRVREGTLVPVSQTAREGTQALLESNSQGWDPMPMSQTARDGTQAPVRRSHFDEEGYQEEEEHLFNILEEERQHWCEVERMHDQLEEGKGVVMVSKMGWARSLAREESRNQRGSCSRKQENFISSKKIVDTEECMWCTKPHTVGDEQPIEGVVQGNGRRNIGDT